MWVMQSIGRGIKTLGGASLTEVIRHKSQLQWHVGGEDDTQASHCYARR